MSDRGSLLYDVLRHVRPLTLSSARVVEASLRPRGMTVAMRAVLEVLDHHGRATVPTIAGDLDLARQAVQRTVNDMVRQDLVVTRPNPAHRRSVLVEPTPHGRAVFAEVSAEELAALEGMATGCTTREIETAVRVIAALADDVRRRARTGTPPSKGGRP